MFRNHELQPLSKFKRIPPTSTLRETIKTKIRNTQDFRKHKEYKITADPSKMSYLIRETQTKSNVFQDHLKHSESMVKTSTCREVPFIVESMQFGESVRSGDL